MSNSAHDALRSCRSVTFLRPLTFFAAVAFSASRHTAYHFSRLFTDSPSSLTSTTLLFSYLECANFSFRRKTKRTYPSIRGKLTHANSFFTTAIIIFFSPLIDMKFPMPSKIFKRQSPHAPYTFLQSRDANTENFRAQNVSNKHAFDIHIRTEPFLSPRSCRCFFFATILDSPTRRRPEPKHRSIVPLSPPSATNSHPERYVDRAVAYKYTTDKPFISSRRTSHRDRDLKKHHLPDGIYSYV